MTDTSLQTRARETERYADAVRELARQLPDDDRALDEALMQAAGDRDEDAFSNLLLAALHAGRPVDARVLEDGAALAYQPEILVTAAVRCTGDVGSALLAAVRAGRLRPEAEVLSLALVAWSSREREDDVPAEAIRHGRVLARHTGTMFSTNMLLVLSDLAGDSGLAELLPCETWATNLARTDFDRAIRESSEDPLTGVPEERPPRVLSGYTVRRAVARVGRNDPCPCGSGKKYKRCCIKKDRERLRHSSDVEGLTVEELRDNPEPHLTPDRLRAMSPNTLARIDATRVEPGLLRPLILRLTRSHEFDAVVRVFESIGCPPKLDDELLDAIDLAAEMDRADVVKRLVALRGEDDDKEFSLKTRIITQDLEPGPMLQLLESSAREDLNDERDPVELAYAMLGDDCPALGILVARGALWTADPFEGWVLLQTLLETRDRLGLSPVDPVEDPIERYWDEEDEDRADRDGGSEANDEARQELNVKLAETRRLRADLRQRDDALREMEQKLEQLEARDSGEAGKGDAPAAAAAPDGAAVELVVELRRKLADRKAEVKRKHNERNELRAELARARRDAESSRARMLDDAARHGANEGPDEPDDESLLIPGESTEDRHPRLPQFERQFADDLHDVPVAVARAALRMVGRLAAGESAAFRGARRLTGNRDVWRQRVGMSHRLLFRVKDDALVVLSLVTREDFSRAIRSLS